MMSLLIDMVVGIEADVEHTASYSMTSSGLRWRLIPWPFSQQSSALTK